MAAPFLPPDEGMVVEVRAPTRAPDRGDPVSEVVLRDAGGTLHTARIVAGPSRRGGRVSLAGILVPELGQAAKLAPTSWRTGTPSNRYTPGLGTWAKSALPVVITLSLADPRDLPDGAAVPELALALDAWAAPSCSGFRATLGPRADVPPGDDGVNVVVWHDDAWPAELLPRVLAQTVLHTDGSGNLYDADVHVNGKDHRWSVEETVGTADPRGVLTHEIGHVLGLNHSTDPIATMYASSEDGVAWRSLERDDRDGVCALYAGQGAGDCTSGLPCPQGYACLARACIRSGERRDVCSPCDRVPGACESAGDDARCIDLGSGGRVCGRACLADADCGAGFHCRATTAAGDLQCVADDGCASGPARCAHDEDCARFAPLAAICREGACVGPAPADDGAGDAGADAAANDAGDSVAPHGGCSSSGGPVDAGHVWVYLAVMLFARKSPRGSHLRRGAAGLGLLTTFLFGCADDPPPRQAVKSAPLAGDAACHAVVERLDSLSAHNEGPDPAVRQKPDGPKRPDRVSYLFDIRVKNPTSGDRWIVFPKHFAPDNKDVAPFGGGQVKKLSATALGGRGRVVLVQAEGEGGFDAVLLPAGGRVVLHNVPIQAEWSMKHKTGKADFILAKQVSVDGEPLAREIQGDLLSDGDGEGTFDADPKDELAVTKIFGQGQPSGPVEIDEECRVVGQAILNNKEPE